MDACRGSNVCCYGYGDNSDAGNKSYELKPDRAPGILVFLGFSHLCEEVVGLIFPRPFHHLCLLGEFTPLLEGFLG